MLQRSRKMKKKTYIKLMAATVLTSTYEAELEDF